MFPSGLAAQEGTIQRGDEVLSINGQTLRGVTHTDATNALRQARGLKLAVVVVSKRAEEEGREGGGCRSDEPNPASELHNTSTFPKRAHSLLAWHHKTKSKIRIRLEILFTDCIYRLHCCHDPWKVWA